MSGAPTIRPFETIEEYRACVALQEDTWGGGFSERVSAAILKVSRILGGVAAGAYDDSGALVGFVFGMTGVRDGEVVHWSDMLAVRPEVRDSGLGTRLKAYQRERVMELGVRKMFWTFDPLQSRNAYLNVCKLGIVAREYREDMYGQTDSPLHRGIGTDRFVALWLLDSERVATRLDAALGVGAAAARPPRPEDALAGAAVVLGTARGSGHPTPGEPVTDSEEEVVAVEIPTDIVSLMGDDPELARVWRARTRAVFVHYLARGYEVREFARGGRTSAYVLRHASRGEEL